MKLSGGEQDRLLVQSEINSLRELGKDPGLEFMWW